MIMGRFRLLAGGWIKLSGLQRSIPSCDPSEHDTSKSSEPRPQSKQSQASQKEGEAGNG